MKKLIYLLFISTFYLQSVSAQNIELKWSSKMKYKNSKDGFFESYIGSSENAVYGTFKNITSYSSSSKKKVKKLKLVAFDKKTMKKIDEFTLKNSRDKSRSSKIKGLNFEKIIVLNEHILIFWSKYSSGQYEIFAETLNLDLGKKDKMRKICTFKNVIAKESFWTTSSLVFLGSKELGTDVLIGSEVDNGTGKNVGFEYVTIGTDLKEVYKGKVDLPVLKKALRPTYLSALYCNYELGLDGNLFIKSNVILSKEERKLAKPGEQIAFSILNVVDVESNNVETYELKFDGINIFNFNILNEGDVVRIYGFFSDIEKDPEGLRSHGIFFSTIKDGEMDELKYTYFNQETLEKLAKKPAENSQVIASNSKKSKKSKNVAPVQNNESIDQNYQIEVIKFLDNDHVVLFCSQVRNYIITTCTSSSSGTSCRSEPFCDKKNVTVFNLTSTGDIVWCANVNRKKTFDGWDIDDLKIVSDESKYYVIYGNSLKEKSAIGPFSEKRRSEARDFFDYAVIDKKSGEAVAKEKMVNSSSTAKKERKAIHTPAIAVFDNQYFISSTKKRINPYILTTGCVFSLFFPPLVAIPLLVPAFKEGTGYVGTIKINK